MSYEVLTATGTIGWLLLMVRSTIRDCKAGHAPTALVGFLVLSIVAVDGWAVAPLAMEREWSRTLTLCLLWPAAIFPYLSLAWGLIRMLGRPKTESDRQP